MQFKVENNYRKGSTNEAINCRECEHFVRGDKVAGLAVATLRPGEGRCVLMRLEVSIRYKARADHTCDAQVMSEAHKEKMQRFSDHILNGTAKPRKKQKKMILATSEQENERANLVKTIDSLGRQKPKRAYDRRRCLLKKTEAEKILKKLPPGMLTASGALQVRGPVVNNPLVKIWLEGVAIAMDGAESADAAWENYTSGAWGPEPPISREYFLCEFK